MRAEETVVLIRFISSNVGKIFFLSTILSGDTNKANVHSGELGENLIARISTSLRETDVLQRINELDILIKFNKGLVTKSVCRDCMKTNSLIY